MFFLFWGASLIIIFSGIYNSSYEPPQVTEKGSVKSKSISPVPTPNITPTKPNTPTPSNLPVNQTKTPTPNPDSADIHVYPYNSPSPTNTLKTNKKNNSPDLLVQINNFRKEKGLATLSANSETCFFANLRSQEIINNFNHDGFNNRIDSNSLPYPSYTLVAENIAMNPDSDEVVPAWINSSGHNENMSKDAPFGCVVGNGDYYAFEVWKP